MWSFGCIVAELFQKKPLFAGASDIEQLGIVTSALGEPPFFWAQDLPDYNKITFNTADQPPGSTWLDNLEQAISSRLESGEERRDATANSHSAVARADSTGHSTSHSTSHRTDSTSSNNAGSSSGSSIKAILDLVHSVLKYTNRKTAQQLFTNHRLFAEIRQTGIPANRLIKCAIIKQMSGPNKK